MARHPPSESSQKPVARFKAARPFVVRLWPGTRSCDSELIDHSDLDFRPRDCSVYIVLNSCEAPERSDNLALSHAANSCSRRPGVKTFHSINATQGNE